MKKNSLPPNNRAQLNSIPCAIYTRKSSEEGLEQNFNSLDAQREACEAYILSQKAEGWKALTTPYDDGGYTGGNMERPGLKQLMADILGKKIRIVVVYKVDRLTRSLADFAKMVELFDEYGVSFVSITQQFNTTSSMGRLTLNVLLSFAQFEREVTGERIRDKIAASKAKGMWMGGAPPVGYEVEEKSLIIHESSAALIREIYQLYLAVGTVRLLKGELDCRGLRTPARVSMRQNQTGNLPFSRGHLYRILSNPIYIGQVAHRGLVYKGQHQPIIDQSVWEAVQAKLLSNQNGHKTRTHATDAALLSGLVFGENGEPLLSIHSNKRISKPISKSDSNSNTVHEHSKRYRYYVSQKLTQGLRSDSIHSLRIPASELERAVIGRVIPFLQHGADLLKLIDQHGLEDAVATHAVLDRAYKMSEVLSPMTQPNYASLVIPILNSIIERVNVFAKQIEIQLTFQSLIKEVSEYYQISPDAWTHFDWSGLSHTIMLPIQIKRSGLAVRLIVEPAEHRIKRSADPKMLKLLSKANIWFDRLTKKNISMQQIADQENVTRSYVSRIIRLAFLSPDIVKAIMSGKAPEMLTVDKLVKNIPLPIDWKDQHQLLGFD
ncbi:MAG: recombinase family protein [Candidatus Paceibacterota bacterium]